MAVFGTYLLNNRGHQGSWNESVVLWEGHNLSNEKYVHSMYGYAT